MIEVSLVNWGRAMNAAWQDGPRENAKSAGWHNLVTTKYADNEAPPPAIDEDDAERIQHAMVRCQINDLKTANTLKWHYRDNKSVQGVKRARNLFWRWL